METYIPIHPGRTSMRGSDIDIDIETAIMSYWLVDRIVSESLYFYTICPFLHKCESWIFRVRSFEWRERRTPCSLTSHHYPRRPSLYIPRPLLLSRASFHAPSESWWAPHGWFDRLKLELKHLTRKAQTTTYFPSLSKMRKASLKSCSGSLDFLISIWNIVVRRW